MIQVLLAISLAPFAGDNSVEATGMLNSVSGFEWFLEAFAFGSLAMSVILFSWVSARHHRTEQDLRQRLNALAATNAELRQENDELTLIVRPSQLTIGGLP